MARRLAAISAGDVVGYSRLMAADQQQLRMIGFTEAQIDAADALAGNRGWGGRPLDADRPCSPSGS